MDKRTTFITAAVVVAVFGASVLSTLSFTQEQSQRPNGPARAASPPDHETNIIIPDLVSKETSVARASLEGLGMKVAIEESGSPSGLWGEVSDQAPAAGSSVLPGSTVTLTSTVPARAPLELPQVKDGAACPATRAHLSRRFRYVVGRGPIRLASATRSGVVKLRGTRTQGETYRTSALWTTDGKFKDAALIRGDRIDGPGGISFEQDPEYTPHGPVVHGAPDELHFVRGGPPGNFAWSTVITYLGGPGCYAFQIESSDLVDHLVVEARL